MTIQSLTESYGDRYFNGLDMSKLSRDRAYLLISNQRDEAAYLYSRYTDCINCPFTSNLGELPYNLTATISTKYKQEYKVLTEDVGNLSGNQNYSVICDLETTFGQFGVYSLKIEGDACTLETLKEPVNIYLPILTVILIYLGLFLLLGVSKYLISTFRNKRNQFDPTNDVSVVKKERVRSLDTFRGITIILMIFVNYGGGAYNFFDHAIWNGLQVADLVFPWFLWIMGVCIPMSTRSVLKAGTPTSKVLLNIARRSVILFMIGIFLGSGQVLESFRVFGVLQRFGVAYFLIASVSFLMMKDLERVDEVKTNKIHLLFADIIKTRGPWAIMAIIFVIHTVIITLVTADGCPSGYLGPGGIHENGIYENCTGGITGYIDRVILGDHMYQSAAITSIYKSQAFEPEGILGFLPTFIQVFFGVQAGVTLMTYRTHKDRLMRWIAWAVVTGLVGGGLCKFSQEDGAFPLNKQLWSTSFVLVTSSLAFILLSFCYVLVDVKKIWSGKPFLYAGMNAILMYIGHSMTYGNFPIRWALEKNNTHFVRLLENVWACLMWLLISYLLYRKKWFLTI